MLRIFLSKVWKLNIPSTYIKINKKIQLILLFAWRQNRYLDALVLGCVYYKLKWKSSLMMSCQLNRLKLLEELLTNKGIARKIKGRGQPSVAEY